MQAVPDLRIKRAAVVSMFSHSSRAPVNPLLSQNKTISNGKWGIEVSVERCVDFN